MVTLLEYLPSLILITSEHGILLEQNMFSECARLEHNIYVQKYVTLSGNTTICHSLLLVKGKGALQLINICSKTDIFKYI